MVVRVTNACSRQYQKTTNHFLVELPVRPFSVMKSPDCRWYFHEMYEEKILDMFHKPLRRPSRSSIHETCPETVSKTSQDTGKGKAVASEVGK